MTIRPTTNIANKVRNTNLSSKKPLWPLFESISNSIHAIEEKKNKDGEIKIHLIRNGAENILRKEKDVNQYPMCIPVNLCHSFRSNCATLKLGVS